LRTSTGGGCTVSISVLVFGSDFVRRCFVGVGVVFGAFHFSFSPVLVIVTSKNADNRKPGKLLNMRRSF